MFFVKKVIVKQTRDKGKGVFAIGDILSGTVIGDYKGKVIRPKDENEQERGLYTLWYSDSAMIEADPLLPGVHLMNHSCLPNCGIFSFKRHGLFFALRRIFRGEELTVDYWLDPQDKDCAPCTHTCRCGTILCRGTMHLTKTKLKAVDRYVDHQSKNVSPKPPVPYGKILPPLSQYPLSLSDDLIYPLFGFRKKSPFILRNVSLPSIAFLRRYIRQTGRVIKFPKLNLTVEGIVEGRVVAHKL